MCSKPGLQPLSPAWAGDSPEAGSHDAWILEDRQGRDQFRSHTCIISCCRKHSPLLGDFLDLVVREQYRIFNPVLSINFGRNYLTGCRGRDPEMPDWNESTRKRLRSSVFQILAQAAISEKYQSWAPKVHIASQVLRYLEEHQEHYVLRCIQVSHGWI